MIILALQQLLAVSFPGKQKSQVFAFRADATGLPGTE